MRSHRRFPHAVEAIRAPAKRVISKTFAIAGRPRSAAPRLWTPARPHLVRRSDGTIFLIEDRRCRKVQSDTARALQRVLGPLREVTELHHDGTTEEPRAVESVVPPNVSALAAHTPSGSSIVVAGEVESDFSNSGRQVERLTVDLRARGGADPDRGDGALDRLSRARAQGATHLLVTPPQRAWLARDAHLADHLARQACVVACNSAGTLWELPRRHPAGDAKIFVIGLPKTGTTSLHRAFELLGLRSFHWGGGRAYQAVLQSLRDGERLLERLGERDDAYSDIETLSVRFDLADLQYPGSRFIFTVRDVDDWIASRRRHVERNERSRLDGTYSGRNFGIDEDAWRAQWLEQCARVTTWFRGRDDLLVLDICAGEGWERLAPFLDRATPDAQFPRENVDGEVSSRFASWRRRR